MSAVNAKLRGGSNMATYLAAMAQAVGQASGVRAGFLEKEQYPAKPRQPLMHVAQVAFWNEFGTSRTKPRPFFRQMIHKELGDWGDKLAKNLRASKFDAVAAFSLLGEEIKDALTNEIRSWPGDNAPSTIARKGFNHGLVDQGIMQRATGYEVLGAG